VSVYIYVISIFITTYVFEFVQDTYIHILYSTIDNPYYVNLLTVYYVRNNEIKWRIIRYLLEYKLLIVTVDSITILGLYTLLQVIHITPQDPPTLFMYMTFSTSIHINTYCILLVQHLIGITTYNVYHKLCSQRGLVH
jgi:hypothetical protein